MKTFVADIIPRIQRYSQKLDNLTLLTNQHWVVLDDINQAKTVYIFRDTNELLISTNGKVEKGKWEYLGKNSILIDFKDQAYLYRHGFFDENVLALKIDGKEEYALLINESKYQRELNTLSSVLDFLNHHYPNNSADSEVSIRDIKYKSDGNLSKIGYFEKFAVSFSNGKKVDIYERLSNGEYFIYTHNDMLFFSNRETCLDYLLDQISLGRYTKKLDLKK
jgi:hypothetical protein